MTIGDHFSDKKENVIKVFKLKGKQHFDAQKYCIYLKKKYTYLQL